MVANTRSHRIHNSALHFILKVVFLFVNFDRFDSFKHLSKFVYNRGAFEGQAESSLRKYHRGTIFVSDQAADDHKNAEESQHGVEQVQHYHLSETLKNHNQLDTQHIHQAAVQYTQILKKSFDSLAGMFIP